MDTNSIAAMVGSGIASFVTYVFGKKKGREENIPSNSNGLGGRVTTLEANTKNLGEALKEVKEDVKEVKEVLTDTNQTLARIEERLDLSLRIKFESK